MRTLLENITFVKGIEYLIIVAFCLGFIALWILVHNKENIKKTVLLIISLSLIFAGGAIAINKYFDPDNNHVDANIIASFPGYYSNGTPVIITGHSPEKWLSVNNSEYLAMTYGPATKFHQIMINKVSCQTCHHNSDEIHACKDCHERPFSPDNPNKPGLKAAYHERCMYCHKEVFGGPESCAFCHTRGAPESPTLESMSIPVRPHELTWENCNKCHTVIPGQNMKIVYHDSCLKCHTRGIAGAKKIPDDHTGRANDTCSGCHKPSVVTQGEQIQ